MYMPPCVISGLKGCPATYITGSMSSYQCVQWSAVLCGILIGHIRESAGQHFSNRDRRSRMGEPRGGMKELL